MIYKSHTEQMRFEFDRTKRRDRSPSADEIAEKASRGEDVSAYFTNKFTVVQPVRRIKVTRGRQALDEGRVRRVR